MKTANIIPTTEARKRLFELTENVQKPDTVYVFTQHGKARSVLLSAHLFDSLIETLNIQQEIPNINTIISEARQDFLIGDYVTLDALKKEYAEVSNLPQKVSRKRAVKSA